jgi:Na+/melibiose symporter-like transporter
VESKPTHTPPVAGHSEHLSKLEFQVLPDFRFRLLHRIEFNEQRPAVFCNRVAGASRLGWRNVHGTDGCFVVWFILPIYQLRMLRRFGKKPLVLVCLSGLLSLIFVTIYFLGKLPFAPSNQMYILVICASFPLAALGILPNAILADIAQKDTIETGENHEGMFFAVKYLFVKLGQTLGIAIFAMLTIYGKDPGNDYGLRLNGVVGFVLCVLALLFFTRFKERK